MNRVKPKPARGSGTELAVGSYGTLQGHTEVNLLHKFSAIPRLSFNIPISILHPHSITTPPFWNNF